jgi:hypothetical protein
VAERNGFRSPRVRNTALPLLEDSYKEVLDATKHQDDKIGRLFTGIAFLTAAALALANLGSARFLMQSYALGRDLRLGVLFLSAFLVCVVLTVMLLINSLATPLRVPGLAQAPPPVDIDWAHGVRSSQLYFGEISTLGVAEWQRKWTSTDENLKAERAQALVRETHNLASRTNFKYHRTSEAVAVFNLALLALALTIVCVATAAVVGTSKVPISPPASARWALSSVVGTFVFVQLQGQVRYSRQNVDEMVPPMMLWAGRARYVWVFCATVWTVVVGSGQVFDNPWKRLLFVVAVIGVIALAVGTWLQTLHLADSAPGDSNKGAARASRRRQWRGTWTAIVLSLTLAVLAFCVPWRTPLFALGLVLSAAFLLTAYSALTPTLSVHRTLRKYRERATGRGEPVRGFLETFEHNEQVERLLQHLRLMRRIRLKRQRQDAPEPSPAGEHPPHETSPQPPS